MNRLWLAMLLVTASAAQPSDSAISGAWGWTMARTAKGLTPKAA